MSSGLRTIAILAAVLVAGIVIAAIIVHRRHAPVTLTGVVLGQDPDPRRQLPIANVQIMASEGDRGASAESDTSGLFHLTLPNGGWRDQPVSLAFRHSGYQPLTLAAGMNGELYIVRMTSIPPPPTSSPAPRTVILKDVRVRYSEKTASTVSVGSTAKTFTVSNTGDIPCAARPPCSPDGKWKAVNGGVTLDAGPEQQFENARVSCIAGPCPFTRIDSGAVPPPGRIITVRVTAWSDTVTFLVEAEVTRSMPSDAIRQAYPAIYGRSMSFTLPATGEGPSIEADLDGSEIVFPLGPGLKLSWAECTLQVANKTKLYRCELKPGYRFQ